MGVAFKQVNNAMVFYDEDFPHRWYEALGEGVSKYLQEFLALASDDTTGDPTEWEIALVEVAGASEAVVIDRAGGALELSTGDNEDDSLNYQLGAVAGENILLDGSYPCYFGTRLAFSDATNSDFTIGITVTDTEMLGGVADGIYFRTADAEDALEFVVENTASETVIGAGPIEDDVYVELEFLFDGQDVIGYFNGQEIGRVNKSSPDFPDDTELRLGFEFQAGAAGSLTCTLEHLRMIHIR